MKNDLIYIQNACKSFLRKWNHFDLNGLENFSIEQVEKTCEIANSDFFTCLKDYYKRFISPDGHLKWTVEFFRKNGTDGIVSIQYFFLLVPRFLAYYGDYRRSHDHRKFGHPFNKYSKISVEDDFRQHYLNIKHTLEHIIAQADYLLKLYE